MLIDPGMGRSNLVRCLAEAEPEGFVAIPLAHAVRTLLRRRSRRRAECDRGPALVLGRRHARRTAASATAPAPAAGRQRRPTIRRRSSSPPAAPARPKACSTGTATSIAAGGRAARLLRHSAGRNRSARLSAVRPVQLRDGGDDRRARHGPDAARAGRPAQHRGGDQRLAARRRPSVRPRFGTWSADTANSEGVKLPTLRRVLSAGAPVPPHVLRRMKAVHPSRRRRSYALRRDRGRCRSRRSRPPKCWAKRPPACAEGAGTCVGRRFPGIRWKVIRIVDGPICETIDRVEELPRGEIGELIVQRSRRDARVRYPPRSQRANTRFATAKAFGIGMGDVGYLDEQDRFWFCGRKAHRVRTASGALYTIPCEAIFNQHPERLPLGAGRRRPAGEAAPDHRGRAVARALAEVDAGPPRLKLRAASPGPES